jgi:hypothetical protein
MESTTFYNQQIEKHTSDLAIAKRRVQLFVAMRLSWFLVISSLLYVFWSNNSLFAVFLAFGIIVFLILVHFSVNQRVQLELVTKLLEITQAEHRALKGDYSFFSSGDAFKNSLHPFSNDLDLFGEKGVFRMLNRTTSKRGEQFLADQLLNGANQIEEKHQFLDRLQHEMEWTHLFRAHGSIRSRESGTNKSLSNWAKNYIPESYWMKIVMYAAPLISIPALILYNYDVLNSMWFSLILIGTATPTLRSVKKTNQIAANLSSVEPRIKVIYEQLKLIKLLKDKDRIFGNWSEELFQTNQGAEEAIKKLLVIQKRFDLRMNIVVSIPLNLFLAWDLRQRVALNDFMNSYTDFFEEYEQKLAEMEYFISTSTLRFNHPETILPTFHESTTMILSELTHPLLACKSSVSNSLRLTENEQIVILTGPNMAGKSTFLRSVGLTLVMANAGFPVFAKTASIPHVKLYSSMRTSDDLSEESSYFHAELTRLKFIVSAIENGEKVFLLLDEILKGTNSKDKEEGSKRFLQKLKSLNTKGIIATHDLSLCELAQVNNAFVNYYFDSTIQDENLYFDYTIRPGVCKNMNASFLLERMGLV